ncbi:hypothetical protein OQA88_5791 [Cercophora sp. LCS_1]
MRFDQELHQLIIPEWSDSYVNYDFLKGLVKSSDLPGIYSKLSLKSSLGDLLYLTRAYEPL